jgi:hypothetical protein
MFFGTWQKFQVLLSTIFRIIKTSYCRSLRTTQAWYLQVFKGSLRMLPRDSSGLSKDGSWSTMSNQADITESSLYQNLHIGIDVSLVGLCYLKIRAS